MRFYFFIKLFLHTFCQKLTFCYPTTFIESLMTHKRFIFKESYISYGKRQKSCTLIVVLVKCLYLTSPIFNSLAKSDRTFYLPGRKYIFVTTKHIWLLLCNDLKRARILNQEVGRYKDRFWPWILLIKAIYYFSFQNLSYLLLCCETNWSLIIFISIFDRTNLLNWNPWGIQFVIT